MLRVLALGDSFTEGVGDDRGGWTRRLPADRFLVDNRGIGGDTSRGLLARLPDAVVWDVATVQVGTNDSRWRPSLGGPEVPLAEFEDNLRQIVHRLTTVVDRLSLIGLTQVDESLTAPFKPDKIYRNVALREYDAVIQRVARDTASRYVGVAVAGWDAGLLADGLHPNGRGHQAIASAVGDALESG